MFLESDNLFHIHHWRVVRIKKSWKTKTRGRNWRVVRVRWGIKERHH